LYLNVWTKPQAGEKKKAVLVWIYGGGFVVGSAANEAYNGALLAEDQDVIVASMNYRISVLGFPGVGLPERNLGLLDQRAAIEWLRDNVEQFGGDPKRITIFGQSAGGYSVDAYSYAYTEDPIVAGLIPQSGTVSATPVPVDVDENGNTETAVKTWSDLSVALNCGEVTAADVTNTLACMKGKPLEAVMNATDPRGAQSAARAWRPSYDNKTFFDDIAERRDRGAFIQVVRPLHARYDCDTLLILDSRCWLATRTTNLQRLKGSSDRTTTKGKTVGLLLQLSTDVKPMYLPGVMCTRANSPIKILDQRSQTFEEHGMVRNWHSYLGRPISRTREGTRPTHRMSPSLLRR